jgi:prophage tail gpP-like protein
VSDYTEIVTVTVGGLRLEGWQEVTFARSMKEAASSFGLRAANPAWSEDAFALRFGRDVTLAASGAQLTRGDIDVYEAEAEGEKVQVRVSGRSRSARAVDSPPAKHRTGRIENKTLIEAAQELDEFGIGIVADVPLKPIALIQRGPFETAFQTLNRYAQAEGVMLTTDQDGRLRITRGDTKRHAGELRVGTGRIKSWKVSIRNDAKASPVITRGQGRIGTLREDTQRETTVFDPTVGGYRPAIIFPETEQGRREATRRGEWKRLRNSGSGLTVKMTVHGWRDDAGQLWDPGRSMFVAVPRERIEQDMRLQDVTLTQSLKDGTIAELTFVDPKTTGGGKESVTAAARNKSSTAYAVPAWALEAE